VNTATLPLVLSTAEAVYFHCRLRVRPPEVDDEVWLELMLKVWSAIADQATTSITVDFPQALLALSSVDPFAQVGQEMVGQRLLLALSQMITELACTEQVQDAVLQVGEVPESEPSYKERTGG